MSATVSDAQVITIVLGRFEPFTRAADVDLEQLLARHSPQAHISGTTTDYELLVRLRVRRADGLADRDPNSVSVSTMLAARDGARSQNPPGVDILRDVNLPRHDEPARPRVARQAAREGTSGSPLTRREDEVLELLSDGLTNREIADRLHISVRTVSTYVSMIFRKLGVRRRQQLVGVRVRHRRK